MAALIYVTWRGSLETTHQLSIHVHSLHILPKKHTVQCSISSSF